MSRSLVRLAVELVVLSLVVAAVVAAAWGVLAPDVQGENTTFGVAVSSVEARQQFGVEAAFAVLAAVGGLVCGTAGLLRHRRQPATTVIVLVVSGLLGSVAAWRLGVLLGPGPLSERAAGLQVGASLSVPLDVYAFGVLLVWPIAALAGAIVAAALLADERPWASEVSQRARFVPSSRQ